MLFSSPATKEIIVRDGDRLTRHIAHDDVSQAAYLAGDHPGGECFPDRGF